MSTWADYLRQTVLGSTTPIDVTRVGRRARVPFKFTSDLWLSQVPNALQNEVAVSGNTTTTIGSGAVIITGARTAATALDPSTNQTRFPIVRMAVNPQSIRWTQPKRFSKRDTMDGSTFMHFLNSNKEDNDLARLEFRGTTGNISLKGSGPPGRATGPDDTRGAEKLETFHRLWALTRQAKIYISSVTNKWHVNQQYIVYESQVLPFPVTLVGFYDRVLDLEESADKPNQAHYSLSFIVQDTHPDRNTISLMMEAGLTQFTQAQVAGGTK